MKLAIVPDILLIRKWNYRRLAKETMFSNNCLSPVMPAVALLLAKAGCDNY